VSAGLSAIKEIRPLLHQLTTLLATLALAVMITRYLWWFMLVMIVRPVLSVAVLFFTRPGGTSDSEKLRPNLPQA
jgi:hypothetical protein